MPVHTCAAHVTYSGSLIQSSHWANFQNSEVQTREKSVDIRRIFKNILCKMLINLKIWGVSRKFFRFGFFGGNWNFLVETLAERNTADVKWPSVWYISSTWLLFMNFNSSLSKLQGYLDELIYSLLISCQMVKFFESFPEFSGHFESF